MGRDCLSGPRCCTGIDCRDVYLRPDRPDWEQFATAEGEYEDGFWHAAYIGPTSSNPTMAQRSRRWNMTDGQQLSPPTNLLASGSRAWFHTVELDGDADLTWAGGTIQLRASAGTVTAGGSAVPIVADGDDVGANEQIRTKLVLYVTEQWYAVFAIRYHVLQMSFTQQVYSTSRSSIQCIDRDNDVDQRSVTMTAVGHVNVYGWQVADASVQIEDGAVFARCSRPEIPMGTERGFLFQTADTKSFNFNLPWDPGGGLATYPSTLSFTSTPEVDIHVPWTCYDEENNPVSMLESYAGPMEAGIAASIAPFFPFEWRDIPDSLVFMGTSDGGILGPALNGGHLLVAVATAHYDCCPDEQTCGEGIDMFSIRMHTTLWLSMHSYWKGPSAEEPYPKVANEYRLNVDDAGDNRSVVAYASYGADGRAPATMHVVGYEVPPFPDIRTEFTHLAISWAAE